MSWKTIARPGYFGKKRDELVAGWDGLHGVGNWRLAYAFGEAVLSRRDGIQIYEDAYYEYFKNHPAKLEWLVNAASDIYDTAPTNVEAGLDYDYPQDTPNNHVHVVSIRRAVVRLGEHFRGDHVMEVRWTSSEGYSLSPGIVPFHRPDLILPGELQNASGKKVWWNAGTIEDFYQRNKLLQIRE